MAKKKRAESGQAVVIALVFFVLLCIGLAVATFAGFSEQSGLEAKIKDEQKQAKSNKDARDWQQFVRLMQQSALGFNLSKDDEEALALFYKRYAEGKLGTSEKDKDDTDKMIKKLIDDLGFDPNKVKFGRNFLAEGRMKDEKMKMAAKSVADSNKQSAEARTNFERRAKTFEEELKKLQKTIEDKEKGIGEAKNNVSKEFAALKKMVEDWIAEREKLEEKHNGDKNTLVAQIEKLKKDLKNAEDRYQKTIIQIKPVDMTVHDDPKGKILRLDSTGSLAYIDLGFADNAKPQLKFSVYPAGATKAMGDRKAAVEIVNVLAAHLSAARVIEVGDNRNPIVANDTLFNPAWSPTLKQHIAIAGLVDLSGEGTNNTDEFMRDMEKQNILIDAYMDLKDPEYGLKGEMTYRTNFLVLGEVPNIDKAMPENDPRMVQATKILTRLSEMQNQAGRLGITIVPARRFMALVGYKTPKSIRPAEYATQGNMTAPPKPAAKPAAEKGEGGEEKMEKPKAKKAKDKEEAMEGEEKMEKPKAKKAKDKEEAMEKDDEKPKAKAKKDKDEEK